MLLGLPKLEMKPQSGAAGAPLPRSCHSSFPRPGLSNLSSPSRPPGLPSAQVLLRRHHEPFRESPVLFPSPHDRPAAPHVSAQGWELKAAAQRRSANTVHGLCLCSWDAAIPNKDYPAIGERRKLELCVDSKVTRDPAMILSSWDSCYPEGYKVL